MKKNEYELLKQRYATFGKGRSHRLKGFDYSIPGYPFYITTCTRENERFLNNADLSGCFVSTVEDAIRKYNLKAYILGVMPTHYHFLFELTETSGVSLFQVMKSINGKSRLYGYKMLGEKIWQRGYYEHIIRREENVIEIAKYISANPKRWKEQGKPRPGDRFVVKWFVNMKEE